MPGGLSIRWASSVHDHAAEPPPRKCPRPDGSRFNRALPKESPCRKWSGMVDVSAVYNMSPVATIRLPGGSVKRKAAIAALAVFATAAGVVLPRTFEAMKPSPAQAQTRDAGPQTVPVIAGTVV